MACSELATEDCTASLHRVFTIMSSLILSYAVSWIFFWHKIRYYIDNSFLQTQAQLRAGVDPSLFLTSYADVSASFSTGGTAKYVQGTNNAALFTLAGNGIASGVVTLDACSLFVPHSHARSFYFLFLPPPTRLCLSIGHGACIGGIVGHRFYAK